ncbi:MAG: CRISPR system precrRNA processing endoribonuclease RAMP protein Cas6 [Candidatus Entotheonellia bacterium]
MLASFIISLQIDRDISLPGLGGEALHGLFFAALRGHANAFAEQLHAVQDDKPFTLSGILTTHPKRDGHLHIPAHTTTEFRVSLLTDEMIEHTLTTFAGLAATDTPLRLGSGSARVQAIAFQPGTHPAVRSATYPALVQAASDAARITLHFLSPTSFRAGDVQEILPKPERVFGSLFKTWQTFAPITLDHTLTNAFARIRVSEYELRTELIAFARYKVIGFKGRVTFTCPRDLDATTRRMINALADFACFAGVGYKTTMGLGQMHRRS